MIRWNTLHLALFQHPAWIIKLFLMVICMYALMRLSQFNPGNELFDTFSEDLSFGFNEFYQIAFENEHGKDQRPSSNYQEGAQCRVFHAESWLLLTDC